MEKEEVVVCTEQRFPCSQWWSSRFSSGPPRAQPMNSHGGADIPLQPQEDTTGEQVNVQREAQEQASGWTCEAVDEICPCWRRFVGRNCDPVDGIGGRAFCFWGIGAPGRTHVGAGEDWDEEAVSEIAMNWLQPPFLIPLHCWEEEVENQG